MIKLPNSIKVQARVISAHSNAMFKVELENGFEALVYLSGRMRINKIKVVPGDEVTVELSPYDLTRGRITSRKKI